MAAKSRKPAPAKSRANQPRATQSNAGAGPALAERSKDAKAAFGKAAPKKVVPAAHKATPKAAKPHRPATGKAGPIRAVASAATGAVAATARLAASMLGRGAKAKTK